jgi:uncharacterized protein YjdB
VTIFSVDDFDLSDFFEYIKIDISDYVYDVIPDMSTADPGVTFGADPNSLQVFNAQGTDSFAPAATGIMPMTSLLNLKFGLDITRGNYGLKGSFDITLKVKAKVSLSIKLFKKSYIGIEFSIGHESELKARIDVSASKAKDIINLPLIKVPICVGVVAGVEFSLPIEVEAGVGVNFSYKFEAEVGFTANSNSGFQVYKKKGGSASEVSVTGEGGLSIGPKLEANVVFIDKKFAYAAVGKQLGLKIDGKVTSSHLTWHISTPLKKHECALCVEGEGYLFSQTYSEVSVGKSKNKYYIETRPLPNNPLFSFYVSLINSSDSFHGGDVVAEIKALSLLKCPNYSYRTTINPRDHTGKSMPTAKATVTNSLGKDFNDRKDRGAFYLYSGNYTATAIGDNHIFTDEPFTVDNESQTVNISSELFIPVTGITLGNPVETIKEGREEILKAEVNPSNATNRSMTWESSDESIAKVDIGGKLTAVSDGTAIITVMAGGKSAAFTITVLPKPENDIEFHETVVSMPLNKTIIVNADVPSSINASDLRWSSSAPTVATFDWNGTYGVVTAVSTGQTTITLKTADGFLEDFCTVTVWDNVDYFSNANGFIPTVTYNSANTPNTISGKRVLVNFHSAGTAINRTITLSSTVEEIVFVGEPLKTYTGLNLVVEGSTDIAFSNFNYVGGTGAPALRFSGTGANGNPSIYSIVNSNSISGRSNHDAVIGSENLDIYGNANLKIDHGGNNGFGAIVFSGGKLDIDMDATLTVQGSQGAGSGGHGGMGITANRVNILGNSVVVLHGGNGGTGKTGTTGKTGGQSGTGGKGGNGGRPLDVSNFSTSVQSSSFSISPQSSLTLHAGRGGNGGKGGPSAFLVTAGKGGAGGDNGAILFITGAVYSLPYNSTGGSEGNAATAIGGGAGRGANGPSTNTLAVRLPIV